MGVIDLPNGVEVAVSPSGDPVAREFSNNGRRHFFGDF